MPGDLAELSQALAEKIRTRAQAVRDRPTDPEVHGRLGILYEAHGYREPALQCYANAISADPSNPRWRFHWAVVTARLGDATGAERALREVITMAPDHASARERLGLLLLKRSAHSEATECFKRVIQLRPNEPQGYVDAARVELAMKRYESAAEWLSKALTISPTNAEAHYLLGRAYRGLGRLHEATEELIHGRDAQPQVLADPWRLAITQARTTQSAQHKIAVLLMNRGELTEALSMLTKVLEHEPNNIDVMNNLAIVYLRLRRLKDARRILNQALAVRREYFITQVNLASVLLAQGDPVAALQHAEQATRLAPNMVRPFHAKASALAQMGRYEEALASFRQAARLGGRDVNVHLGIGEMLVRLKRWGEAVKPFETAVQLDSQSVQARYNLGIVYAQTGQFDRAAETLRAALALDPGSKRVKSALQRCEAHLPEK